MYSLQHSFKAALILSLCVHAFALAPWRGSHFQKEDAVRDIQVTYVKIKSQAAKNTGREYRRQAAPEAQKKIEPYQKADQPKPELISVKQVKDNIDNTGQKTDINTPDPADISVEQKESPQTNIPAELTGEEGPAYISYYGVIREIIRARLSDNYYRRFGEGEVNINFMLSSEGHLEKIDIVDGLSTKSRVLRQITLQGVRDSAPFPPFPKNIDHDALAFNMVISFRPR